MNNKIKLGLLTILLGALGFADLLGAGATFPQPLYSKMFAVYEQQKGVKVNYQGIGSGGGIKQLTEKVIDFGGTDAYMTDQEISATGAKIVHIPTCIGAVVIAYNIPDNPDLKLTPALVSKIFNGEINKWNDPQIAAVNPGLKLNGDIFVVHRSDSSGTTSIFTDYLSQIDPANWKMSKTFSTKSKLAVGGKGNSGVAGLIKQMPGSIGYTEIAYANQNQMKYAAVQNSSGVFITPSLASTSAAADVEIAADTRASIVNTKARDGYPICGFTWIVAYQDMSKNPAKAKETTELLKWIIADGQAFTRELDYGSLPKSVAAKALANINSIKVN
ncbi:MAG: phosphate ABC transporter substrate-binding protein PstS [Candidatus Margulisbacteria bacterium]|jgi:phosphate transport system substrate-binding protein|nr:phosphate ABC transporter substrate-binding protein PstS [Candidatus Margulisiibacteriota bacterium]